MYTICNYQIRITSISTTSNIYIISLCWKHSKSSCVSILKYTINYWLYSPYCATCKKKKKEPAIKKYNQYIQATLQTELSQNATLKGHTQENKAQDRPGGEGWMCWAQASQPSSLCLNSQAPVVSLGSTHLCSFVIHSLTSFSCDSFHFSPGDWANLFSYIKEYNDTNPDWELLKM
jgi:hypothetical protein